MKLEDSILFVRDNHLESYTLNDLVEYACEVGKLSEEQQKVFMDILVKIFNRPVLVPVGLNPKPGGVTYVNCF